MINHQNMGRITILLLFFTLFNSCITRKDLLYLQDINDLEEQKVPGKSPEYLIKPDDNLYINILTPDQDVSKLFNPSQAIGSNTGGTAQNYGTPAGLYINGFIVDKTGAIVLPILGSIPISGKTALEAQAIIQEKANTFLKKASVQVKVLSFKVTLLGELRNPGVFYNDCFGGHRNGRRSNRKWAIEPIACGQKNAYWE